MGFPQGGPKTSEKSNFWPFQKFTSLYLCNRYKYRHISSIRKNALSIPYPTVASVWTHRPRVLQGGPKSKWRNTSFGDYELSTVSVFLSVVKCCRVCREQTCAHYGTESSRFAKQFPHCRGSKTSRNLHLFRSFLAFTSPIYQQPLKIEPYKQRTYLFNRPCTPCRNPVKPVPVKKLSRMRMAGLCQFYWRSC